MGRALLAAAAACALLLGPAAGTAPAQPGQLLQLSGSFGCTTEGGKARCARGVGLRGAASTAVSPDGRNVYVASAGSSALTTYRRGGRNGRITQLPGKRGCVSAHRAGTCAEGRGLQGAYAVAVSADGANVYVASSDAIAVFRRNSNSGVLRQLRGSRACLGQSGAEGCSPARALSDVTSLAVSPDGRHVYTTAVRSDAVAAFDREQRSGRLTQLPGTEGCLSADGAEGCATGRALSGAFSLAISPSGAEVFVSASHSDAVAALARDPSSGRLTQHPGIDGCASRDAEEGCALARGLLNPNGIAVSPDGKNVYVASSGSFEHPTHTGIATFDVLPAGGLRQPGGEAGCTTLIGHDGCGRAGSLGGSFAVAPSPDGDNVYLASQESVTTFRRRGSGTLRATDCTSEAGHHDCAAGRALKGASGVALDPRGRHAYVTAADSDGVAVFARSPHGGRLRVRIAGVPRRCARGPFRARVRVRSLLPLRAVRVFLNGRRVGGSRQATLRIRVRPQRLPRGGHRLQVRGVDVTGEVSQHRERFRRC